MKWIENIEIKNFKSIRHQKIEGCKKINVFIGYPNVGKSNILEAMSLISYLKKGDYLSIKQFCRFKELIDLFSDGEKQKDAEIRADNYIFFLRFVNKDELDFGVADSRGYIENRDLPSSDYLKYIKISKDGTLKIYSSKDYDDSALTLKKYDFRISERPTHSNPTILNFPYGENLAEVIRYNNSLRKECGELFADYNLKLIFDENDSLIVQKQLDEFTAFQFSFFQVADTLQRLIFNKAAIATNENTVLLFEEPEAHMFPPYIRKFTADVIFDKTNQFFIATHSPYVIQEFIEEASEDLAVYVVDYDNGETVIKKLTEDEVVEIAQFGIDLFFNLESYLDKYGQSRST